MTAAGSVAQRYTLLGIETSCDETAAAIVRGHPDGAREILSNVVLSQLDAHRPYGGVVPEIAARAHVEQLDRIIAAAMEEADLDWTALDAVAATAGPGLIAGVMVGLVTGKAIAAARNLPLLAINHLEGHALSPRLSADVAFPYLLLLVSGGHCQLLLVRGVGRYERLGTTLDDAIGEAFDKTAKMLDLPYPGGPSVEAAACVGDAGRFDLPRPMVGRDNCDFSFSGLKTAVLHTLGKLERVSDRDAADIAAAFQAAVCDVLVDRTAKAMQLFHAAYADTPPRLVIAGGVAANRAIAAALSGLCAETGFSQTVPPLNLCTDNGAMIAWAGVERFALGHSDPLDVAPRARWPLTQLQG